MKRLICREVRYMEGEKHTYYQVPEFDGKNIPVKEAARLM